MPRTISSASLTKLATQLGTEPVNIIEIQWVDGGPRVAYGDKTETGVKGVIQAISGLDDVVQVSLGSKSQQISVTLSDTDGSLKGIMDSIDPHKRPCWVYQWFEGISQTDKFLVFKGVLNSPIEWNEGDRTLKFDVVSKIEDVEVGFSIEEGDFLNPPKELIGKPWPLCFGTVINVPGLRVNSIHQGILAQGTGIHDFTLQKRITLAGKIICPENFVGFVATPVNNSFGSIRTDPVYEPDAGCLQSKCVELERCKLELSEQLAAEFSPIRIFGGNLFPQHKRITLNINNGLFTGTFSGEIFTITGRQHPDNDGKGNIIKTDTQQTINSRCGIPDTTGSGNCPSIIIPDGTPGKDQTLFAQASKQTWDCYNSVKAAGFFWANAGSRVTLQGEQQVVYIANLLPSTVLRVAAFRTIDGLRSLYTVPPAYYSVRQVNYTGYTGVTEVVLAQPLSTRDLKNGGGWEDEIFITLTSSVGPNTVDILQWFISTYTDYTVDSTSFNAVRTLIDNYPMHFPLLERKNLITVLEEIAYQARCALWLKDDVFYIKYLSLEPTADDTVTENDVLPNTYRIEHTPTEGLVTVYTAKWKEDYALTEDNTAIYRHNVTKYGMHKQEYNFYCFNILELVRKSATFWLIRKANTWRRAIFQTPINKLKLETFDTVALTLPDVADGTIKGTVEKANYNSDSHTIDFEVWTPCKAGTRTPYDLAWPADIAELTIFPTIEEEQNHFAGGGRAPNFTTIAPPGHVLSNKTATGGSSGFQLECNGDPVDFNGHCHSDKGDHKPSDRGDTKPSPNASSDQTGAISTGTSPVNVGTWITNTQFQQLKDQTNQALSTAQQANINAAEAMKQAGGEKSEEGDAAAQKNKLPDEVGGNCTCVATVTYIIPDTIHRPPGTDPFFGSTPGDKGQIVTGTQTRIESYTFNSKVMADSFVAEKQAEIDALSDYNYTVGKEDVFHTSGCVDLGIDEDPDSDNFGEPCPELAAEERAMTAFSQSPIG
jgi:hypothetical protein